MPCYHPLIRAESPTQLEKNKSKAGYHKKFWVYNADNYEMYETMKKMGNYMMMIPCDKCIGCKLDYSREWANRGYLESKLWTNNWFLTLTYDETNLYIPDEIEDDDGFTYCREDAEIDWKGCLVPKEAKKFMHDLRQHMERKYKNVGIRFMECGEYGDKGERPHYHFILYNLDLPLEDLYNPVIKNNEVYYQSHTIDKLWKKGIYNITEVSWNTIAYVARYITKKINGNQSSGMYAEKGQIKEFFNVSRMPGIGQGYFEKYWKDIYKNDEIIVKNRNGVIKSKPPAYFDRLLEKKDPKLYKEIRWKRRIESHKKAMLHYENTSLLPLEQLAVEERTHEEKHRQLIREMEKGKQ